MPGSAAANVSQVCVADSVSLLGWTCWLRSCVLMAFSFLFFHFSLRYQKRIIYAEKRMT